MMRKILLLGAAGNMGRRYTVICEHLGIQVVKSDLTLDAPMYPRLSDLDGVIIATPTEKHLQHIIRAAEYKVPILCEKPVVKDIASIGYLKDAVLSTGIDLAVVNQYQFLRGVSLANDGLTSYNYYKTGQDGLLWDTISIIGLANGRVEIDNTSPVWRCQINGSEVSIGDMDLAYVEMIRAWATNPKRALGIDFIEKSTKKVLAMMGEKRSETHYSFDRNSGAFYECTAT